LETILIVGFGSIGKRYYENILQMRKFQIIVCSKRNDLQKKNMIVVKTILEALKYKPKIAFITNETSFHVDAALLLAKNGVHLFIEKPLSNSLKNITKLKKIVDKKKLITQIGCDHRFHPCIKKIKEFVDKKTLGRIISVSVESSSYLPDWHPYEDYKIGYAARDDLGGGITLTMIHELDFLRWFFGDVRKIFAVVGKFSELEVKTDDLSMMTLIFNQNIVAQLSLDYFQRPEFKSCKIKGVKGMLYWDSKLNEVKIFQKNQNKWTIVLKVRNFKRNSMFVDEINYFLRKVQDKKRTFNDLDEGIKTLQVALSAKKSSNVKKLVNLG